jgi:hypothetical protein
MRIKDLCIARKMLFFVSDELEVAFRRGFFGGDGVAKGARG